MAKVSLNRDAEYRLYGGLKTFNDFFIKEAVYPANCLVEQQSGIVVFKFGLNINGEVEDFKVDSSTNKSFLAEAKRLFDKTCWISIPKVDITSVTVHTITFEFDYKKFNKLIKKRGYDTLSCPYYPLNSSNFVYTQNKVDSEAVPIFEQNSMNLSTFLLRNLQYPAEAKYRNIRGAVAVKFVIEQSGNVSAMHPIKAIGGGCTAEAIRLIELINWHPAIVDGKAVRSWYVIEIMFAPT